MSRKCIVVIDDNRIMIDFMTHLLVQQGHRVLSARDGISALALLTHETPDIIFLDMIMPRISGDDLVPIIRKMPHLDRAKIIIISAAATELQASGSLEGVEACLAKRPFKEMGQQVIRLIETLAVETPNPPESTASIRPRRITQELLSRSGHLQSILESISEGVLELDAGRIVFTNTAACRLLELNVDAVLGKRLPDLFPESFQPAVERLVDNSDREVQLRLHDRHLALERMPRQQSTGSTVLLLRDITAVRQREHSLRLDQDRLESMVQERTAELAAANRSLTDEIRRRTEIESSLRNTHERFELFMAHINAAAFIKDPDGRYVYANTACATLMGKSADEMLGRDDSHLWLPETAHLMKTAERQVRAGGGEVTQDVPFATQGGQRQLLVSAFSIPKDGTTVYVAGFAIDVSDRKAAEVEQRRLIEQLQRARKMEAIGMLAGAVAHDLNNILSGLVSYPELLLMDLPADSPLRKPLETIKASGDQAAATVQDLLTLARRNIATCEVLQLNALVNAYLSGGEHQRLCRTHPGLTVDCRLAVDAMPVIGSRMLLMKVIGHVVAHAAAAVDGGGAVRITTENRYIDQPVTGYDAVAEGDYVLFTVADTGTLIPEEYLDRLFEPLFVKRVLKRHSTGLGLAMVWGAVKDHGGMIDVASDAAQGNRITIYFPASRQRITAPSPPLAIEGKNESILVVDDVTEQRAIASDILTRLGYRVVAVGSGEAAVAYMEQETADLVVLDMIMEPGIDGLETFRRILTVRPGQRVIIASGFTETDRVRQAQQLGAGAYLKKPYLIDTLGEAVRRALDTADA